MARLATKIFLNSDFGSDAVNRLRRKISRSVGEVELVHVSGSKQLLLVFNSSSLMEESARRQRVLKALRDMNPHVLSMQWISENHPRKRSTSNRA